MEVKKPYLKWQKNGNYKQYESKKVCLKEKHCTKSQLEISFHIHQPYMPLEPSPGQKRKENLSY